jgi:hypothetical protein
MEDVIPTGAANSLIVRGAVEGPLYLSLPLISHAEDNLRST